MVLWRVPCAAAALRLTTHNDSKTPAANVLSVEANLGRVNIPSVVVPSHNGAHRLRVLLPALARQDFDGNWEVIVCLDGSEDESRRLLSDWEARLPLRVIDSPQRRGVSETLNAGFDAAVGSVLIRCDDDLTPRPDFLTRHLRWHRDRDDLGVIGLTRDVFPDTPYARLYGKRASERAGSEAQRTVAGQRWVHWAANNSIHRRTWEMSGGFDPRFLYGQDSEFGFRLQQLGVEIVIDPDLTTDHRGPATTVQRRARRAYVSGASRRMREELHAAAIQPQVVDTSRRDLKAAVWRSAANMLQGRLNSADSAEHLGHQLDLVLPLLPPAAAEKAVAFLVETAAMAGYERAPVSLALFSDIKGRELRDEGMPSTHSGWPSEYRPGVTDPISVVIPFYGDPQSTMPLVEALLAEQAQLEIIVVDDCSPVPFPADDRCMIVRATRNGGFGTAVNLGAAKASNPWLLVLNSDVAFEPGFLPKLLAAATPVQPAVCGVRQIDVQGNPLVSYRHDHTPVSVVLPRMPRLARLRRFHWFRSAANIVDPLDDIGGAVDWLVGSLLLLPRAAFMEAGGFDEQFFMYSEEADLQRRLRLRGIPAVLLSDLVIVHEGGASTGNLDVAGEQLRSQLKYLEKWHGPPSRQRVQSLLARLDLYTPAEKSRREQHFPERANSADANDDEGPLPT